MKDNIVVTLYCGDGRIDKAFEYLNILYLSNYRSGALYGVVADLPPSVCYSAVSDRDISESAERNIDILSRRYGAYFFCAVRPRHYNVGSKKRPYPYYSCNGSAQEALRDIILYFSGDKGVFLSVYGSTEISDHGMIFFTDCGIQMPNEYFPWEKGYRVNKTQIPVLPCAGDIDSLRGIFLSHGGKKAVHPEKLRKINSKTDGIYPIEPIKFENLGDGLICRRIKPERMTEIRKSEVKSAEIKPPKINSAIKRAAGCAADAFHELYKNGCGRLYSALDILYALCGAAAMRIFGFFGLQETLTVSDALLERLKFITGTEETEGAEGESALCLTALAGAYSRFGEELPEFYLLKSEAEEIISFILPRTKLSQMAGNTVSGILGMLCYKEINTAVSPSDKLPVMSKKILFGDDEEDFWRYIQGKLGTMDICTSSCILVRAAQICFASPFSEFLFMSEIVRAKAGILNKLRPLEETAMRRRSSLTGRLVRRLEFTAGLRPVRERFQNLGCDPELLQYVAYLDTCAGDMAVVTEGDAVNNCERDNGSGRKLICFCADEAYTLLIHILRAAKAVERDIELTVITRDSYSHKKLKEANRLVTVVTSEDKERCRSLRERAAYFRQLTPFTTLSELLRSV